MAEFTTYDEQGLAAPANLERPYGSTYTWLKDGKTYVQKAFGIGKNWVEESAGGGGGDGIYGGDGTVPSDTKVNITDKLTFDGVIEITDDLISKNLIIKSDTTEGWIPVATSAPVSPEVYAKVVYVDTFDLPGPRLYVSDYYNTVYVFDASNLSLITSFNIPDGVYGLAYNEAAQRIYVGDYLGGQFTYYIDIPFDNVVTTDIGVSGYSRDLLSYNAFSNLIYSWDYNSNQLIIYDADFNFVSANNLLLGYNGYDIVTNALNGKIYLPILNNFFQSEIVIFDSSLAPLNTISVSFNFNQATGSAFDSSRNRAYIAQSDFTGNSVVIVDGVTDLEITTVILPSIPNAQIHDINYNENVILVGLDSFNTRYYYSIDPDSLAITLISSEPLSSGGYAGGTFNGTDYFIMANSFEVKKLEESTDFFKSTLVGPDPIDGNYTHELQSKNGIIAHLDDIPPPIDTLVGNILYVSTLGKTVAGGAERNNLTDHFSSLSDARNAAQAGDTIVVNPGVYSNPGNLFKADVDYYFMPGAQVNFFGSIFTGGVGTCNVFGKGDFTQLGASGTPAFYFINASTISTFEANNITVYGNVGFELTNGNVDIKANEIKMTYRQYLLYFRITAAGSRFHIKANKLINLNGSGLTNARVLMFREIAETADIRVECPKMEQLGTASFGTPIFGIELTSPGVPLIIGDIYDNRVGSFGDASCYNRVSYTHIGNIYTNCDVRSMNIDFGIPKVITMKGNIYNFSTNTGKPAITTGSSNGELNFEGDIYCSNDTTITLGGSNWKTTFKGNIYNTHDDSVIVTGIAVNNATHDLILEEFKAIFDAAVPLAGSYSITGTNNNIRVYCAKVLSNIAIDPATIDLTTGVTPINYLNVI